MLTGDAVMIAKRLGWTRMKLPKPAYLASGADWIAVTDRASNCLWITGRDARGRVCFIRHTGHDVGELLDAIGVWSEHDEAF